MAERLKGRAIIAVCDITQNPSLSRRSKALAGTMIIYRKGVEVARSDGEAGGAFATEMAALGLTVPGA